MRITERGLGRAGMNGLFESLAASGVDTLHSSDEYETFATFAQSVHSYCRQTGWCPSHVAKIAEPHFGETSFVAERFEARVHQYLDALGARSLSVVQWMIRADPQNVPLRHAILRRDAEEIGACFAALRRQGLIGAVAVFPYDPADIEVFLDYEWCDGLVVYLNPLELENVGALDAASGKSKGIIIIRPLGAGRGLAAVRARATVDGWPTRYADPATCCLSWPLMRSEVASVVTSISTLAHLKHAVEATRGSPSPVDFAKLLSAFRGRTPFPSPRPR